MDQNKPKGIYIKTRWIIITVIILNIFILYFIFDYVRDRESFVIDSNFNSIYNIGIQDGQQMLLQQLIDRTKQGEQDIFVEFNNSQIDFKITLDPT